MTKERLKAIKKEWSDWRFLFGTTYSDHQEAQRMLIQLGRDSQTKTPELIAEIDRLRAGLEGLREANDCPETESRNARIDAALGGKG